MALDIKQFGVPNDAATGSLPTLFHFWTADDAIATVVASAYFDDVASKLHVGDVIYCNASDTSEYVEVTSANGVTPVTVDSITGSAGDDIAYMGSVEWSGGGATLAHTVTGVLGSDQVSAIWKNAPTEASAISVAVPSADTITFTVTAANTSNDGVVSYVVYRGT